MRNVFLFTRREYLQAVRKKSFLVFTMLTPLLMFAFTVLPSKLMMARQAGSMRLDASVRGRLERLRQQLATTR